MPDLDTGDPGPGNGQLQGVFYIVCPHGAGNHWPDNVRELENVIEGAILLSAGDELEVSLTMENRDESGVSFHVDLPLDELQRRYITHILNKTNGKIGGRAWCLEFLKVPFFI